MSTGSHSQSHTCSSPPDGKKDQVTDIVRQSYRRQKRIMEAASQRIGGVRIVLENITNHGNRAAILRTVEALGFLYVDEIITQGPDNEDKQKQIRRGDCRSIVNGAEKWLVIKKFASVKDYMEKMNKLNVKVYAAMPPDAETGTPEAMKHRKLEELDFYEGSFADDTTKYALVFGNEGAGISDDMKKYCHATFSVPMYGLTESLNVSVTVGICAHHARNKRLAGVASDKKKDGTSDVPKTDLDGEDQKWLQNEYARRSKENNFVKNKKVERKIMNSDGKNNMEEG